MLKVHFQVVAQTALKLLFLCDTITRQFDVRLIEPRKTIALLSINVCQNFLSERLHRRYVRKEG